MGTNIGIRRAIGAIIGVTILATTVPAALAAAPPGASAPPIAVAPVLKSVVFTGSSAAPTITVNGTGFGAHPPTAYPNDTTSCGPYTNNGNLYGAYGLWFLDNTHFWQAGRGNARGGNCIGLIVTSWTRTQVVFEFGSAYGTFDHWTVDQGDNYVLALKSSFFGGVASY